MAGEVNYGDIVVDGGREAVQRLAGGVAGTTTAVTIGEAVVAAGCTSAMCTVGLPVVAGLAAASGAAVIAGWAWDAVFG